jgi:CTP:molybdopterin cytidylyltransferase MocA
VIDAHPDAVHYIEAESDAILRDVDTPEAYAEERRRAGLPKSFIDAGHPP